MNYWHIQYDPRPPFQESLDPPMAAAVTAASAAVGNDVAIINNMPIPLSLPYYNFYNAPSLFLSQFLQEPKTPSREIPNT